MEHSNVILALSVGLFLGAQAAQAAVEYRWVGGNGTSWSTESNWNPAGTPGSADSVVFDSTSTADSCVDAGFAGIVDDVVIESGYTGTITLSRQLDVLTKFTQKDGVFDCGANDLVIGFSNSSDRPGGHTNNRGNFQLAGGRFTAPSGRLKWLPGRLVTSFAISGGDFDNNGGTLEIRLATVNDGRNFYCTNVTFSTVEFLPDENTASRELGGLLNLYATNTVTKCLTHYDARLKNGAAGAFRVTGDFKCGVRAGGLTAPVIFCGEGDQTVTGELPSHSTGLWGNYGGTTTLVIDKPSGTLFMKGDCVKIGSLFANGQPRFTWKAGKIDMSGLDTFMFSTYNSSSTIPDEADITWAKNVIVKGGYAGWLYFNNQTFNNFHLHDATYGQCKANSTNTVLGTLSMSHEFRGNYSEWLVYGDVIATNLTGWASAGGGNSLVTLVGDKPSRIVTDAKFFLPSITIKKDEGVEVTVESPDGNLKVSQNAMGSTLRSGLYIMSGILTMPANDVILNRLSSGKFCHAGGTVNWGTAGLVISNVNQNVIDADLTIPRLAVYGDNWFRVQTKRAVTVTELFKLHGAAVPINHSSPGPITIEGDIELSNTKTKNYSLPLKIAGSKVQRYKNAYPSINTSGAITIEKDGGCLVLDSDMCFTNSSSHKVLWKSGKVKPQGRLFAGRTLDISSGAGLVLSPKLDAGTGVTAYTSLELPASGAFDVELEGKVRGDDPKKLVLFNWPSAMSNYDDSRWNVTGPPNTGRFKVFNDETEKEIYLTYKHLGGFSLILR